MHCLLIGGASNVKVFKGSKLIAFHCNFELLRADALAFGELPGKMDSMITSISRRCIAAPLNRKWNEVP
jgi:hypothetical protein